MLEKNGHNSHSEHTINEDESRNELILLVVLVKKSRKQVEK